jgi:hypothetical protein
VPAEYAITRTLPSARSQFPPAGCGLLNRSWLHESAGLNCAYRPGRLPGHAVTVNAPPGPAPPNEFWFGNARSVW